MSMSVVYSAPIVAVAEDIEPGDVLLFNGTGYVLSTAAARAALSGRRSTGVALTAGDERTGVTMAVTGPLPTLITGLAAGAECFVRTSTGGRLERVASPDPSDDVMGWCDASGRVTALTPGARQGDGIQGWTNVRAFGARGDGVTDDLPAFIAGIAAAGDGVLWVPAGRYRLSGNLPVHRRTHMIGAGGVYRAEVDPTNVSTSVLVFDDGAGLVLDNNTTSGGLGSASGSVFEHIGLEQSEDEASGTHVVTQNARTIWRGCTIYGNELGGHGWYVPGPPLNNEVTESAWYDCHAHLTGGDGWHIETGNQYISGGSAHDCVGKGVYIACVFGCTVVGTRLRGCGVDENIGFQATGAAGDEHGQGQHAIIGCGVSGGNGEIYLGQSANWVGGPSSVEFTANSRGWRHQYAADTSPLIVNNSKSGKTISSSLGIDSTAEIAYQYQTSDDSNEVRHYYDGSVANTRRWLHRYMGFSTGQWEITIAGHIEGAGQLLLPRGMVLGPSANRRYQTTGSAAPTGNSPRANGAWARGDVVWNDFTVNTTVSYWQCSTAGIGGVAVFTAHNL